MVYNIDMIRLFGDDIREKLNAFDSIAVAVSGGRDSVALLHFLAHGGFCRKLSVLHVNHRIRGEESEEDRDFVLSLAAEYGLPALSYEENVPAFCAERGYGIEQGARIVRREIFERTVSSGKADRVLTAHHLSDQTESVLMHVFRGCGIDGLCGMKEDDGVIFRPLLATPRELVERYIAENGLRYREDSTNADPSYTRNYLRGTVIPAIKKMYPSLDENVRRLSAAARDAAAYIDTASADPRAQNGEALIPDEAFVRHPAAVAASVAKALSAVGARVDSERVHIEAIEALYFKNCGARVCLPHDFVAERRRGGVAVFRAEKAEKDMSEAAFGEGRFEIGGRAFCVNKEGGELRLDAAKVPEGSVFRTRRVGDRFRRFGGGDKTLGDYLTDIKYPKSRRDSLAVLAHGNRVLAVVGVEISSDVAVGPDSEATYIRSEER